jgi:hypothetical protein
MFNKYFIQQADTEGNKAIARSIREHGRKLESISQAEIKSKDRVDIPLSEYIEMREKIEKQESKLRSVYCIIKRLGIPMEVIDGIVPDTIQVYRDEDIRDFVTHYMITFDVDAGLDILRRSYR